MVAAELALNDTELTPALSEDDDEDDAAFAAATRGTMRHELAYMCVIVSLHVCVC